MVCFFHGHSGSPREGVCIFLGCRPHFPSPLALCLLHCMCPLPWTCHRFPAHAPEMENNSL